MLQKGAKSGLPFLGHFGMWGDILLISPLSALIVAYYSKQWTPASLARPRDRGVEQAGDADPMRQLTFDGGLDEARREEGQ
jgi:hypothetical protein